MERIASFTVNHDKITEGIYISRIDGDITTYDMRMRKPNMGDYIDNLTIHSLEHMFATYVRNSDSTFDIFALAAIAISSNRISLYSTAFIFNPP